MSLAVIQNAFAEGFLRNLEFIRLCGSFGDPIHCPELIEIIQFFLAQSPKTVVAIHTNGGVKEIEFWQRLGRICSESRIYCIFSIDGLKDTNHLYRRGVNWDRLMQNSAAFIEVGGNAWWEYLVFHHNEHQVDDARKMAEEMGFKKFLWKRPQGFWPDEKRTKLQISVHDKKVPYIIEPAKNPKFESQLSLLVKEDDPMPKQPKNFQENFQQKIRLQEKVSNTINETGYFEVHPRLINSLENKVTCQALNRREVYISSDGLIYPCCYFHLAHRSFRASSEALQIKEIYSKIDLSKINLNSATFEEVLGHSFFKRELVGMWGSCEDKNKILACAVHCGPESCDLKIYSNQTEFENEV